MIPRRLEFALEQLFTRLADYDLAVADRTAAALHTLTIDEPDHAIQLAARNPMDPAQTAVLAEQLHTVLARLQPVFVTGAGTSRHHGTVTSSVGDDHASALLATRDGTELLAVEVATVDPTVQPLATVLKAASRDGMPFPTMDQLTVARESLRRWLTAPHDTSRCADLGLAAYRVGADQLWTPHTTRAAAVRPTRLATLLRFEASERLTEAAIPRRLRRPATEGLAEMHTSLTALERRQGGRR